MDWLPPKGCSREPWPPRPPPPADAATRAAGVALKREAGLRMALSAPPSEAGSASRTPRLNAGNGPAAGKPDADLESRKIPGSARNTAAAAAADLMILHAKTGKSGGEMRLDRGRRTGPEDARLRQTHERTILHEAPAPKCGGGSSVEDERWRTSAMASNDPCELRRATRRLARRKMRDASKHFHRCRALPEDEEAALHHRRECQEDEWRRLLRGSRPAVGSQASAATSLLSVPTEATSTRGAGMRTEDTTWRQEDNGCAAYGRQCIALCAGDALRGPPLPLETSVRADPPTASEYQALLPTDDIGRLGRLLQMGGRPP